MRDSESRSAMRLPAALACAALAASLGLCACSPEGQGEGAAPMEATQEGNATEGAGLGNVESPEGTESQAELPTIDSADVGVPLNEVTVTVYGFDMDGNDAVKSMVSETAQKLNRMGLANVVTKNTSSFDMRIVVYRAPEYEALAQQIGKGLSISPVLKIVNDGTDGWSYSTDIAVVV